MKPKVTFIAPNNCSVRVGDDRYFQSYDSVCAKVDTNGKVTLYEDWNYSKTTLKYLKIFLNTSESKNEIQKKLDDGIYKKGL